MIAVHKNYVRSQDNTCIIAGLNASGKLWLVAMCGISVHQKSTATILPDMLVTTYNKKNDLKREVDMFEFLKAGGFLMLPILICSVIALAIVIERFLTLKPRNIVPENIISKAHKLAAGSQTPSKKEIANIRNSSLIGKVLAAGLESSQLPRHIMKENLEETGRHVAHEMDKYMTTLGTIAAVTPLLGLLGTVVGMIEVFSVITKLGVGSPADLAGGISTALITTAAGISVAVPALIFHRYFKGKINDYVVRMEQEALKLVELASEKLRPSPVSTTTAKRPPVRRSPATPNAKSGGSSR